ncbi:hypothetical protein A7U60_g8729 [Sanghuangporus baumii]|uniref:SET domain-containing protein n=1 Tax=Sanghuangporus baumii TaxID=108892 RepID=A0A9Q5HQC4_SANBA|nr:hypothetical protein A7U60_g8729 [Sanghuangporus baumii]
MREIGNRSKPSKLPQSSKANIKNARVDEGEHRRNRTLILSAATAAAAVIVYYLFLKGGVLRSFRNTMPVGDDRAFDVVDIPGKGKGVVAMRDIEVHPYICIESDSSPAQLLKSRLRNLTPSQRDEYYSLSYVHPGKHLKSLSEDDITLAIFQTNGISAGDSVGLFPRTARLNHGCSAAFNSVYSWRSREGNLVVHAIKQIKRGQVDFFFSFEDPEMNSNLNIQQELLTTYMDTKRPRHERQAYVKSNYDFTCTCSVCSLPEVESRTSDKRLSKMTDLYQTFATWGRGEIDGITASRIAKDIWELGEQEGYWSERGRLAGDVVYVASAHSDERGVLAWAHLARKWFSIELGNDSTQALEMQTVLNKTRSHFAWGTRYPQLIELPAHVG